MVDLICKPTPLHRLNRASEALGIELWIKRDDLSGFAGGGNKGRKLEFLIAEALEQGADCFVTRGAYQSNYVRQAAFAARMYGLEFHAAVMHWPHPGPGRETRPKDWQEPTEPTGNMLLDLLADAHIHLYPDSTFEQNDVNSTEIAEKLRGEGRKVYTTPSGGSSPTGALGFVHAVDELLNQAEPFDQIIFASGSGSTQTGLTFGHARAGLRTRLIGVCTDDEPELVDEFAELAEGVADLTLTDLKLTASDFDLRLDYHGGGYQVPSPQANEALRWLARSEGVLLDPVYTAKAFAGLLDLARRGELRGRTLFWHTGGFPTLFARGKSILDPSAARPQ